MQMTSILLIAEPDDAVHQSVKRALMLARYLQARLDLLFWDTERPYTPHSSPAPQVIEQARQYLEALRKSVTAPDVEITIDAAFEGSLQEHIAQKVLKEGTKFVIKSVSRRLTLHGSRVDWQIVRNCPAPLLLTQGRPWQPRARFAVVIDAMDRQAPTLQLAVAQTSALLRLACCADLDLIYAQPDSEPPEEDSPFHLRLQHFARIFSVEPQHLHVHCGNLSETLPRFIAEQRYDLIAAGVSDQPSFAGFVGSLSGQLLRSTGCDLLFVKLDSYMAPTAPAAKATLAMDASTLEMV